MPTGTWWVLNPMGLLAEHAAPEDAPSLASLRPLSSPPPSPQPSQNSNSHRWSNQRGPHSSSHPTTLRGVCTTPCASFILSNSPTGLGIYLLLSSFQHPHPNTHTHTPPPAWVLTAELYSGQARVCLADFLLTSVFIQKLTGACCDGAEGWELCPQGPTTQQACARYCMPTPSPGSAREARDPGPAPFLHLGDRGLRTSARLVRDISFSFKCQ